MGKHSRVKKFRHRVGFFLFASLCLVAGAFAVWYLILAPDGSSKTEPFNKADTPKVAQAPKPAKKEAASKPAMVKVPEIPKGTTEAKAKALLKSKDLKLGEVTKKSSDDVDKGGVISQDPAPKKEVKEGSAVDIAVSSGPKEPAKNSEKGSKDISVANVPAPPSTAMTLTVPAMGKSGEPIGEGVDEGTLYNGPGHAPGTGYPWIA
ncbi:MAG TPA: PASTA domain-containing protein, partial [Rubrobacteraceae bacterium]|nr:PASTA domain-containing protein [Rubrobacteraceae bacterium]